MASGAPALKGSATPDSLIGPPRMLQRSNGSGQRSTCPLEGATVTPPPEEQSIERGPTGAPNATMPHGRSLAGPRLHALARPRRCAAHAPSAATLHGSSPASGSSGPPCAHALARAGCPFIAGSLASMVHRVAPCILTASDDEDVERILGQAPATSTYCCQPMTFCCPWFGSRWSCSSHERSSSESQSASIALTAEPAVATLSL